MVYRNAKELKDTPGSTQCAAKSGHQLNTDRFLLSFKNYSKREVASTEEIWAATTESYKRKTPRAHTIRSLDPVTFLMFHVNIMPSM